MNVILLNDNPAVSRLVKLSLEKIGYKLEEVSNLVQIEGKSADIFICDSALADESVDYTSYGRQILFLVPRNFEKKLGKNSLEKPFLPTDFIDFIQKLSTDPLAQKQKEQEEEKREKLIQTGFDDGVKKADDLDLDFEEVADLDDIFGDKEEPNLDEPSPESQSLSADEINTQLEEPSEELVEPKSSLEEVLGSQIDAQNHDADEPSADELSENEPSTDETGENEPKLSDKEIELAQLNSMLDEIDNMDDKEEEIFDTTHTDELKDFDSISGFIPPQNEAARDDEVVGEEFEDIVSDEDKAEINSLANELVENAMKDGQSTENTADESVADESAEDIADENLGVGLLDEENLAEQESPAELVELPEDVVDESVADENLADENAESLADESLADENLADERVADEKESMADENLGVGLLDEENLAEQESPAELVELPEDIANESVADENLADENAESLADESLVDENLADESLSDESLTDESLADENAENLATEDLDIEAESQEEQKGQVDEETNQAQSKDDELDMLKEADIASALGIEGFEAQKEADEKSAKATTLEKSTNDDTLDAKALENAKSEISSKITEMLGATLANSSIKEAIKGMKIKINISFEN